MRRLMPDLCCNFSPNRVNCIEIPCGLMVNHFEGMQYSIFSENFQYKFVLGTVEFEKPAGAGLKSYDCLLE